MWRRATYEVEGIGTATYMGVHDGTIKLDDGALFGYERCLRFVTETEAGEKRMYMVSDGREVIETTEAKEERERIALAQAARQWAALEEGVKLLGALGIDNPGLPDMSYQERMNCELIIPYHQQETAKLELRGFTIGHLLAILDHLGVSVPEHSMS